MMEELGMKYDVVDIVTPNEHKIELIDCIGPNMIGVEAIVSTLEKSNNTVEIVDIVTPQKSPWEHRIKIEPIVYKLYEVPNEFWYHKTVRRLSETININKEYDLIKAKKVSCQRGNVLK